MADPRDFKLQRGDLPRGFAALTRGAQRPLMAGEHATKDRRRALSDWRKASTAGMPEGQNLQSSGRLDEPVVEIVANAGEVQTTHAG